MEALDVSPAFETLSNLFPVPAPVLLHCYGQLLIFCLGPVALVCSILVLGWPCLVQIGIFPLPSDNLLLLGHGKIFIAVWGSLLQEVWVLGKLLTQACQVISLNALQLCFG